MTLTITPAQHAALAEYRTAYRTNDFNRKVFAIVGLADVGLCESKATELIAMGYDIKTNEGESE